MSPRSARSRSTANHVLAGLTALCIAAPSAESGVLTVDSQGTPGTFPDIQGAVQAATPGDIVLVRGGNYAGFQISKSITVTADMNHVVRVESSAVSNLGPSDQVLISGLRFVLSHSDFITRPSLELRNNQGSVVLQRVLIEAPDDDFATHSVGLFIEDSDAVTVTQSLVFGSEGSQGFAGPGPFLEHDAIHTEQSNVALYDTFALGGEGAKGNFNLLLPDTFLPPTRGGHGVLVRGGTLFAAGCFFGGGRGGDGDISLVHLSCISGKEGGDGLRVENQGTARTLDLTLAGGAGGASGGDLCHAGDSGDPLTVVGGQAAPITGTLPELFFESPVRESNPFFLVLEGEPGSAAVVLLSPQTGHSFVAPFGGVLVTGPAPIAIFPGSLPASGQSLITSPVPELGPGVDGVVITFQAVMAPIAGPPRLSSPSWAIALDAAF